MYGKYVIVNGRPIIFDISIRHADVVKKLDEVESAGFFMLINQDNGNMKISCFGESTSLNKKSMPQKDEVVIGAVLNKLTLNEGFIFSGISN